MGRPNRSPDCFSSGTWLSNGAAIVVVAALGISLANCSVENARTNLAQDEAQAVPQLSAQISGVAAVTDGDTIRINNDRIRFDGIDSPERGKTCGQVDIYQSATDALIALIGSQLVTCNITDEPDQHGRQIGQCSAGDTDLSARMVEIGMARDWPRYSDGAYADEEARAREAGIGVWSPTCPADLWDDRDYSH